MSTLTGYTGQSLPPVRGWAGWNNWSLTCPADSAAPCTFSFLGAAGSWGPLPANVCAEEVIQVTFAGTNFVIDTLQFQ
jgi:hypothetical protein